MHALIIGRNIDDDRSDRYSSENFGASAPTRTPRAIDINIHTVKCKLMMRFHIARRFMFILIMKYEDMRMKESRAARNTRVKSEIILVLGLALSKCQS
jgi:hypothetical protein